MVNIGASIPITVTPRFRPIVVTRFISSSRYLVTRSCTVPSPATFLATDPLVSISSCLSALRSIPYHVDHAERSIEISASPRSSRASPRNCRYAVDRGKTRKHASRRTSLDFLRVSIAFPSTFHRVSRASLSRFYRVSVAPLHRRASWAQRRR